MSRRWNEREITDGPVITGTLTARRHATVRAEVGGVVLTALADRGMTVAAGAPMLRIEDRALRDAQAAAAVDVKTDEDALALAERRLTRSEKLLAGGAIAAEEAEDCATGTHVRRVEAGRVARTRPPRPTRSAARSFARRSLAS